MFGDEKQGGNPLRYNDEEKSFTGVYDYSQPVERPEAGNPLGRQGNPLGQQGNPLNQGVNPMNQGMNPMNQGMNPVNQQMSPLGQQMSPLGQQMSPLGQQMSPLGQQMNTMNQPAGSMDPAYMGYYGQNNVPVYNGGGAGPKKSFFKSKAFKILLGVIGGLIVAAGLAYLFLGVIFSPKNMLKKAIDANKEESYQVAASELTDFLGVKDIMNAYNEKGGSLKLSMEATDNDTELTGTMDDYFVIDKEQKLMSGTVDITDSDSVNIVTKLYGDEDYTYISSSKSDDVYLVVENKDFARKYNESLIVTDGYAKEITTLYSLNYFMSFSASSGKDEEYNSKVDSAWDNAIVKKADKADLELGNGTVSCKGYEVTVKADDARAIAKHVIDKYLDKQMALLGQNSETGSDASMQQYISLMTSLLTSSITEDVKYIAYVYDGHVVAYKFDMDINLYGSRMNLDAEIKYMGKENVLSVREINGTLGAGDSKLDIYIRYGSDKEGDVIKSDLDFRFGSEGSDVALNYDQNYDTSSGDLDCKLELKSDKGYMAVTAAGALEDVETGKSFTLVLDSFNYEDNVTTDEEKSSKNMTMKLKLGISTDISKLEKKDESKEKVYVFTDDKEKVAQYLNESGLFPDLGIKEEEQQITGSSGFDPEELDAWEKDYVTSLAAEAEGVYKLGETWTVDDNWEFTITGIKTLSDRNPTGNDKDPAKVYRITYTYKNLGWEDSYGIWDGLYMYLDNSLDSKGEIGYSYYLTSSTIYPEETPVGQSCTAEKILAFDNEGPIKIVLSEYDKDHNKHVVVFELEP